MAADKEKVLDNAQKYADKNQYDKAIKEILKIVDNNCSDCRILLRLATYYERGQYSAEAVQTMRRIVALYRNEGASQKALAVMKQAQKIDPTNVELTLEAAELYGMLSLTHEATL